MLFIDDYYIFKVFYYIKTKVEMFECFKNLIKAKKNVMVKFNSDNGNNYVKHYVEIIL